ncbi:MAG: hypothetical protein WAO61_05930 [Solirubrobacterales bacterium]
MKLELVELGMEGETPIPEAMQYESIGGRADDTEAWHSVAIALKELVRENLVLIFMGPSNQDTTLVDPEFAIDMLDDPKWFQYGDEPDEVRLEFIASENWKGPRPVFQRRRSDHR